MPTLLQLNCSSNWGSAGRIAEQIGLKAKNAGWESYIIYGRKEYSNVSGNNAILVGNGLVVKEHYLEHRILDREGLASRWVTRKIIGLIESIKPDVIQLHLIHDHWINYRILFSYLAGKQIPVVWTQHDQWATTGHCCINLIGCERWMSECYDCPMKKWYALDRSNRNFRLKRRLCAGLTSLTIVPVSEWLGANIRLSHLKDYPIKVIYNGIDLVTFSPNNADVRAKYGIGKKRIVLGVAAVWSNAKGLADFIKISQTDEFCVVLVGVKDEVKKQLPDNIVAISRTQNQRELAMLYSMADVFVNPTYADMFPTVNLEALACGTPVITYKTGGSPEAVGGRTLDSADMTVEMFPTGAVVECGNIDALISTIEEFLRTDFKAHHTSACRRRAEEYFDKDKCFEKYVELYENLIG